MANSQLQRTHAHVTFLFTPFWRYLQMFMHQLMSRLILQLLVVDTSHPSSYETFLIFLILYEVQAIVALILFEVQAIVVLILYQVQAIVVLILYQVLAIVVQILYEVQAIVVLILYQLQSIVVLILYEVQAILVLILYEGQAIVSGMTLNVHMAVLRLLS